MQMLKEFMENSIILIKREGKQKAQGDITSLPLDCFLIKNKQTNSTW